MKNAFDKLSHLAQINASLKIMRDNMNMINLAKEILLEENYVKLMKSYKFTYWFQLLGTLAGFAIPSVGFLIAFKDVSYCAVGAAIGILWMCIWLPFSLLIPPTRIYRKFAKWYRNRHSTIADLDTIFYQDR